MARDPYITWFKLPADFDVLTHGDDLSYMTDKQATEWAIGTVDAGSPSEYSTFLVWNNWNYVEETAFDMTSCTLGTRTKDSGSYEGVGQAVVQGMWVQARCLSGEDTEATPPTAIGYNTQTESFVEKAIKGWGEVGTQTIKGNINNGTYNDGKTKGTFAEIQIRAYPDTEAPAGLHEFLLRVFYEF